MAIELCYEHRLRKLGPYEVRPFTRHWGSPGPARAFFGAVTASCGTPAVLKLANPSLLENKLRIADEIAALTALGHLTGDRVVRLLDHGSVALTYRDGRTTESPFVVTEQGSTDGFVWTRSGRMGEDWLLLRRWLVHLAQTMHSVHSSGWLHGDLKMDNLFIFERPHGPIPVVGDWGAAAVVGHVRTAPEIGHINEFRPGDEFVEPAWDMYGLGVVLHNLSKTQPWRDVLMRTAADPAFRDCVPAPARRVLGELLNDLLQPSPQARPDARTVLHRLEQLPGADA